MKLRLATPADALKLSEFYRQFPLSGPLQLEVRRADNFFSFYERLAQKHRTYVLEGDELEGMASFIVLNRKILGQQTKLAYSLDFRIKKSRKAVREWSSHFQPVLEEVKREEGCEYFFTSLHHSQVQAYNAFIRPRQARRQLPRYHLFREFRLVSMHGRWPFAPKPLQSLTFRKATIEDKEALISYLEESSKNRSIQMQWKNGGFDDNLENWPGLELEDFFLALTDQGKIVGTAAPWSMNGLKDFVPLTYSARADNFRQILKLGSLFRFAHSLPKPAWKNPNHPPLRFKVVTHLRADHEDIFDSLMTYIWNQLERDQFLVYSHFDNEYWLKPPHSMITTSQAFALYNIIPGGSTLPDTLTPIDDRPADLELAPLVY